MTAAPAMAVFDLLICENSLIDWAPPLVRFFLVGEAFFVKLEEAPLGPLIIFWVGSVDFAVPINGVTKALGLFSEVSDINFRDFLRGSTGSNGIVFGRETESVITERAHGVNFLLHEESRQYIDDGEVTNVADVEAGAGRIRKHLGKHHFWGARLFDGLERLFLFPNFLPFCFDFERFVSIHNIIYYTIL